MRHVAHGIAEESAHDLGQLLRVREKTVVAHLDVEMRIANGLAGLEQAPGDHAALLLGEQPVAGDGDQHQPRVDAAADLVQRTVLLGRVVAVHRVRDVQIGIGVEAGEELSRLVFEIAFNGKHRAKARGVLRLPGGVLRHPRLLLAPAEAAVEEIEREIGDVRHLAGLREAYGRSPVRRAVVVAALPARIERDRVASHHVERERLRVRRRPGGDHHRAVHLAGMRRDPFNHLDAAKAAAHEPREMRDPQLPQQRAIDLHRVANGEARERTAVGPPRRGIDGRRSRRALATAQDVRADDPIEVGVDRAAGADNAVPPAGGLRLARMHPRHVRISRERVADEDHVVVRGRFASAGLPRHVDARQHAAILEAKAAFGELQRHQMRLHDAYGIGFLLVHGVILYHEPADISSTD